MFCDLVGSTTLSGQLDPEDLREVVRAYQEAAASVIQQYDGHIAQYLGDGLLVYFGYPQAHEQEAHRAIHTGLGIVEALKTLNRRLHSAYGIELAVRLGIHTGPVVVGQMGGGGRHEQLALGETPNIAARLVRISHTKCGDLSTQRTAYARGWRLETSPPSLQVPSLKPLVPREVAREAERHFHKAITIAREQHAKSLELRAVMSLVHLRQHQLPQDASQHSNHEACQKLDEAHKLLSELYTWFTEGFETPDLRAAEVLLHVRR